MQSFSEIKRYRGVDREINTCETYALFFSNGQNALCAEYRGKELVDGLDSEEMMYVFETDREEGYPDTYTVAPEEINRCVKICVQQKNGLYAYVDCFVDPI